MQQAVTNYWNSDLDSTNNYNFDCYWNFGGKYSPNCNPSCANPLFPPYMVKEGNFRLNDI